MKYIRSFQQLRIHPKVLKLMNILAISKAQALGHLHLFWWWCGDHAKKGKIGNYSPDIIESACEWNGEKGLMSIALSVAGFIDDDNGQLKVHDWIGCFKNRTKIIEANPKERKESDFQRLVLFFAEIRKCKLENQAMINQFFRKHGKAASSILKMAGNNLDLAKKAVKEISLYLDAQVRKGKFDSWQNLAAVENSFIEWKAELDKETNGDTRRS